MDCRPEFESWKYNALPDCLPETKELVVKVRSIFPNAIVFQDNHVYFNRAHAKNIYAIGECSIITASEPVMITGDYGKTEGHLRIKGKWAETIDAAWQNAWIFIQETMLKKFEQ